MKKAILKDGNKLTKEPVWIIGKTKTGNLEIEWIEKFKDKKKRYCYSIVPVKMIKKIVEHKPIKPIRLFEKYNITLKQYLEIPYPEIIKKLEKKYED